MSFVIEPTKRGKPSIIFNKQKYRESHTLKNGETVWRCLGRYCNSKIKTDSLRTTVSTIDIKHSGPHPVTMRSMSSPLPTSPGNLLQGSTAPASPTTPSSHDTESRTDVAQSTPVETPSLHLSHINSSNKDIEEENNSLKIKISHLSRQLKDVLNHSIESDTRLLQFTDQVFVANTSLTVTSPQSVQCSVTDCEVQCDLPHSCCDERCAENINLIQSLRTTIEVLEAELKCLKNETDGCECKGESGKFHRWSTVDSTGKSRPSVEVKNRFNCLSIENEETTQPSIQKTSENQNKRKKKRKKLATDKKPQSNNTRHKLAPQIPHSLSFPSVLIESDSHGRHLSELVGNMVSSHTMVSGVCKPGARLTSVASRSPPPPGGCSVLFAGSNDVANGECENIYRHLEAIVSSRTKTSKVIVATLPFRHDLPVHHPVNEEIVHVNAFLEGLCARCESVVLLDFNNIDRRYFTRHGMHLTLRGKRILAKLVVEGLVKCDSTPIVDRQTVTPVVTISDRPSVTSEAVDQAPEPSTPEPYTLPHNTYADAVRTTASPETRANNGPPSGTDTTGGPSIPKNCTPLKELALT